MDIQTVPSASNPRRVTFDTLAVWALVLTGAVAALAFIPSATIPFIYSKVSIVAIGGIIALALYILARLTRGNIIVPPAALLGAFWLVPAAYLLSTLFSGGGFRAGLLGTELETDTLGFMILLAAFASIVALTFRRSAQYRIFFKVASIVYAIILAAQVVFLILGHVASAKFSPTANVVGTFSDLGMLAGLGVTISLLAIRFLPLQTRTKRFVWITGAMSLIVLALVNSAFIWALVALTALGLFIEAIMRRAPMAADEDFDGVSEVSLDAEPLHGPETKNLAGPLVVLVVSLFFIIGGGTIGASLVNALGTNYLDVRPSVQSTFAVGSHTYASAPIFGSGPGTFGSQWLTFRDRSLNDTVFWNVDFTSGIGVIPTSAITTGIVGLLAWLAFLSLFFYIGIRALLFRAPEEAYARFVSIASFVGASYIFVLALGTNPGPVVLLAGFFLAGLFVSSLRYGGSRREWGIIFSRNPRVGFVIVFGLTLLLLASVVAAYVVVERYLGSVAYAQAVQDLNAGNLEKGSADINRSLLFAPSDRAYQLAAAASISQMQTIANNTKLTPSQAQQQFQAALSTGIQAATLATQIAPNNYRNWVVLGNVYQAVVPLKIQGAYDNAKAAYTKAIALNPTNPTLPFALAQLEIAQGNGPAAETDLTNAIGLKRDYTQATLLLSQLQVQEGKAKDALQAAEAALYFAPNDQNVLFQVGILRLGTGNTDGAIQALTAAVQQNTQYANARFFLAVAFATKGQFAQALDQLNAISNLSADNAKAVAADIATLKAGKNPFPPARQGQLGIPQTTVSDPSGKPAGSAVTK
ncbi:MAG: Tfp pilus assembly protein PilF [Parcubacteria group bacterium]|nr:Tfp pilus assembly protein PilF [Parcubacteria group bacterium]